MIKKNEKQKIALDHIINHKINLLYGPSRSGKTYIVIHSIVTRCIKYPNHTAMILRKFSNSVRRNIFNETLTKVLKSYNIYDRVKIDKTSMTILFNNGSKILCMGCDNDKQMDKILGIEASSIFIDECTEISYKQYQVIKTRLAQKIEGCNNKLLLCCNPTGTSSWIYKYFIEKIDPDNKNNKIEDDIETTYIPTIDNQDNIDSTYVDMLSKLTGNQRKRFYEGNFIAEWEGALFKYDNIENNKIKDNENIIEYEKIYIGIDPAVTTGENSDETGIIVAGIKNEHYYIIDDKSGKYTSSKIVDIIKQLYNKYYCQKVIVETNQGGNWLIDAIIHNDNTIPVIGIHNKVGKQVRAENISYLYEKNLVHHTKDFIELEEQMTQWTKNITTYSPDRLDALCLVLAQLSFNPEQKLDMDFGDKF